MTEHVRLPITLPNIEEIEAGFNKAMELYTVAFEKIADAEAAIKAAYAAVETVTPGAHYHSPHDAKEVSQFHDAVKLPDRATYLRVARKLINVRCWHYVVDRCGLRQLMDTQAKKELDDQLRYVEERSRRDRYDELITEEEAAKGPPPFTAETVRATIATFQADAHMVWRRGIANVFSTLDRRFRSHDGFKVGSRMILTHFANDDGRIDGYGRQADMFRDVERTFQILDGVDPRHARSDFLHQVKEERKGWKPYQSEHEGQYFRVRIFKNGNAHLWFSRDDLVELVNKELAAYYGEVIGDGQTQEADPLESRAVTHARNFGFFPTPRDLVDVIVRQVPCRSYIKVRVLEPSAGTGNLAFGLVDFQRDYGEFCKLSVDAIEVQPALAELLRGDPRLNSVTCGDFLQMPPTAIYDGVLMNPPFDRERDIDHVTHAAKFLKPEGWLLAIMSAGVEFRESAKGTAFRKFLDERKGWIVDLPAGSFASVGTYVNTVLVGFGMRRPYL